MSTQNFDQLPLSELMNLYDDNASVRIWLITQLRKRECIQPKTSAVHPPYKVMVVKAIMDLNQHKGSSQVLIKRYILENYYVNVNTFNVQLQRQVKRLIDQGVLEKTGESRFLKNIKRISERWQRKMIQQKIIKIDY